MFQNHERLKAEGTILGQKGRSFLEKDKMKNVSQRDFAKASIKQTQLEQVKVPGGFSVHILLTIVCLSIVFVPSLIERL